MSDSSIAPVRHRPTGARIYTRHPISAAMSSDPTYDAISKAKRQSESGNPQGAVKTLEDFLATDPHNVKARMELARIAIYDLKDKEYGLMQLEAILDLDPDNLDAIAAQITVLSADKRNNKVVKEKLEKLEAEMPCAKVYNMCARFYKFQLGDFKGAEQYYLKAIELEPDEYEWHLNYSVLLLNDLRDWVKAKKELEILLEMNPGDPKLKKAYNRLITEKFDANGNVKKKGLFRRRILRLFYGFQQSVAYAYYKYDNPYPRF